MLLSFIPWFLFWVLLSMRKPEPAALSGFFCTLIFILIEKVKGRSVKILNIGTLVFFLALSVLALFTELEWFGHWVSLWSNLSLTLIALVSIVIGKPFTIQYAKEQAPQEVWNSPKFLRVNYIISWVWFSAFLVNLVPSVSRLLGREIPNSLGLVFSILPFLVAIKFTQWYSHRKDKGPSLGKNKI